MNGALLLALLVVGGVNDATLDYQGPPTVERMMASDAFVRVIVGPFGSGKSSGCVMEILQRAMAQEPNAEGVRKTRFAVIRNTRPQLTDTTRKTFEQWISPSMGKWNERDFDFHIKAPLDEYDEATGELVRTTQLDCEVLFRALDSPDDVKKVLSLELTGAYFNELREIPKEIFDGVQARVGRYPSMAEGGPTWDGVWGDTNPWAVGSWGYELFNKGQLPPGFELYEQPPAIDAKGKLHPDAENVENLRDGYYPRLCHGKDASWLDEYLRMKYPLADKGSIYGEWISKLEARGGVLDFAHPKDGIYASFDLGVSDATAIWFWRFGKGGVPDIVDWYECSGQGFTHYAEVLNERGYKYQRIYLPHDARAHHFETNVTTLELFVEEFGVELIDITPEISKEDGIGAGRWLLEQPIRVHSRCEDGLKRLRAYKFAWDDKRKVYSKTPVHDWTSHTADGWRYVGAVVNAAARIAEAETPKRRKPKRIVAAVPTVDDAWKDRDEELDGRKERIG